jgi:hypothetical protein
MSASDNEITLVRDLINSVTAKSDAEVANLRHEVAEMTTLARANSKSIVVMQTRAAVIGAVLGLIISLPLGKIFSTLTEVSK